MNVATANLVGITGITRRLVMDGALSEADARRALEEATKAKKQAQVYLLEQAAGQRRPDRGGQLHRVRHPAVRRLRARVQVLGGEDRQRGPDQQAPGAAAVQARQPPVRRRGGPDQHPRPGRDQVRHQPHRRADPGRRGAPAQHHRPGADRIPIPSARTTRTTKAWRTWRASAATTTPPTPRSTPRATTRRWSSSSTRCCSTRSSAAPPTSTSSPTRASSACACAWTASCARWPRRR